MSFGSSFEDVPKLELAFVSPVKRLPRCERPGTSSRLPTLSMIRTGTIWGHCYAPAAKEISSDRSDRDVGADIRTNLGRLGAHQRRGRPVGGRHLFARHRYDLFARRSDRSQQAHGACCTLCCAAHTATPTADPQASVARVERVADTVVWRDLIFALPLSAAGSNAQARGPPGIS